MAVPAARRSSGDSGRYGGGTPSLAAGAYIWGETLDEKRETPGSTTENYLYSMRDDYERSTYNQRKKCNFTKSQGK